MSGEEVVYLEFHDNIKLVDVALSDNIENKLI